MNISFIKRVTIKASSLFWGLMAISSELFAAKGGGGGSYYSLAQVSSSITKSFEPLSLLITGGCYTGGLAFMVGAIMKFKQHKDNPTQVTIGTPIALTLVGAGLLFMPSVMGMAGMTIFGGGSTAGPSGSIYGS